MSETDPKPHDADPSVPGPDPAASPTTPERAEPTIPGTDQTLDPPAPSGVPAADADTPTADPATLTADEKNLAMLAHLLGAFTSVVGPLIIWLLKKDESAFINQEAREALNFQLTALIAYTLLTVVAFITCGLGGVLIPLVMLAVLILGIVAAVAAKDGKPYRYPLTLRLVQ